MKNHTNNALNCEDVLTFEKNMPNSSFIKANYMPIAFGSLKKLGETQVIEKSTGKKQKALLKYDEIGDYTQIKMTVKGKEAGFLDIYIPADTMDIEDYIDEKALTSEIRHLRSLMGDKYLGIGSALVKAAFSISNKKGCANPLWLEAEKGYAKTLAPYRSDENPIPFYYKLGFEAFDDREDDYIKSCFANGALNMLPESCQLMLSDEAKEKWIQELIKHPIINQ
ncbi:MAG: hypothetical protein PHV37_02500 [Candidatus Gastranaerophilales bacterium]|nr:hypothetical protein [Candidatus Gastranaerophilales bacterium]